MLRLYCNRLSVTRIRINPCNSRIFPKPRALAFCVAARSRLYLFDCLIKRDDPIECRDDFLVTNCLWCGDAFAKASAEEPFDFLDEALFNHLVDASINSIIQDCRIDGKADKACGDGLRDSCELFLLGCVRRAFFEKLERANDASYIVWMDDGSTFRVAFTKSLP